MHEPYGKLRASGERIPSQRNWYSLHLFGAGWLAARLSLLQTQRKANATAYEFSCELVFFLAFDQKMQEHPSSLLADTELGPELVRTNASKAVH
jgi:hypothetical protein